MYIEPGSLWKNLIENFNETFRDECLNMNMLGSAKEARRIVETWRQVYSGFGPHSSLGDFDAVGAFSKSSKRMRGKNQLLTCCAGNFQSASGFLPLPVQKVLSSIIQTGTKK